MQRRSPIEQRRKQISAQLEHLRTQLASKTRKDFTSDFRHRIWLEHSRELIKELLNELSILDDPGEYDQLPAAVVAEELDLRLDEVKLLIKLGEITATGRHAHECVDRRELERLAELGPDELLLLSRQTAEEVFYEAVAYLRSGDVSSTERSYRRLKARQSSIGSYALATEIAIRLVKGMYEEAERIIKFVLREKFGDRLVVGALSAQFLRGVCFKDSKAKADILLLLKPLVDDETIRAIKTSDTLQLDTMYLCAVIQDATKLFTTRLLSLTQEAELNRLIVDAVYSALYAEDRLHTSSKSNAFVLSMKHRIPHYWEPAKVFEELRED